MRAAEIMSAPVVTVRPETSIVDAARLLVRHKIAALPVVGPDHRLEGLVSEADLFHVRAATTWTNLAADEKGRPRDLPLFVRDVMHRDVLWVKATDTLALCAQLMSRHNGRSLPVIREGYLVGIITRRDILRALTRTGQVNEAAQLLRATAGTGAISPHRTSETVPS